jgi:hypothetical protein
MKTILLLTLFIVLNSCAAPYPQNATECEKRCYYFHRYSDYSIEDLNECYQKCKEPDQQPVYQGE